MATPSDPSSSSAEQASPADDDDGEIVAEAEEAPIAYVGHFTPLVIEEFPHDPEAFTQGLEWVDGELLESTGLRGQSSLRLVDSNTGIPSELLTIDDAIFAEGVTVVDDEAILLSYEAETLLRVDLEDLASQQPRLQRAAYPGQGWGLCHQDDGLVMSDGSSILEFRDPATFELRRTVTVTLNGAPIHNLNELECVNGQVWANVWKTPSIVAIDPATGEITATVDATSLIPVGYEDRSDAVLNGIAYNPESDTFWLTGKLWPVIYEVELIAADG